MAELGDDYQERTVKAEIKRVLWLAVPMLGIHLVQFALQTVSLMFVGHLGKLELSSSSIAGSITNVTGFSFMIGLGLVLETLCGQAYGAKQYLMMGLYLQRAMFVLFGISILVAILWFNLEPVLLLLHQAPEVASNGGTYARFLIPGLLAQPFLQPLNRFLLTQGTVLPLFLTSSMTLALHALVCWLLTNKLGLGLRGPALASSISNWLDVGFQIVIVAVVPKCRACWGGLSRQAFEDIGEFLKLALPSALMICLEWWCYEVLILASGLLPNAQLETSTLSIVYNVMNICFVFPLSLATATSIRVANELGARRASLAQLAFNTSISIAVVVSLVISGALLIFHHLVGKAFSDEPEVINYVSRLLPVLAAYTILTALQCIAGGGVRGCGKQVLAAAVDLMAYYPVAVPIALILGFHFKLGALGFLLGLVCGDIIQATIFLSMICCANWEKEVNNAQQRMRLLD